MPLRQHSNVRFGHNSDKRRTSRYVGTGVALLLGVGLLFVTLVAVKRLIVILGTPLLRAGAVLKDTDLLTVSRETLVARVRSLVYENNVLTSRALVTASLEEQNRQLRALLSIRAGTEIFAKTGSILVRPPETPYGLMIVDIGASDGVSVDDIVRISGREHIGKVIALSETTSKILLYSAPDTQTAVLLGDTQHSLIADGMGGFWRLEIPQDLQARLGDVMTAPDSFRGIYGYVVAVDERGGEPYKYVYVSPSVNIQNLSWVDIVRYE
ncbi:MAG: rod shape-determining protein MreC [bacterium]|nr:rod shape-determining protein MreC [bacterium]